MRLEQNNLYDPIMYLIKREFRRKAIADGGGVTGDTSNSAFREYVEPMKLIRDNKGRLAKVEGWENIDVELTYNSKGLLSRVDAIQRISEKHLAINLVYNSKSMLEEIIPEMINEGDDDDVKIDVPSVLEDY
jgi:hypothetical protein